MVDLSKVLVCGSLAPFADGFAAALTADGYSPHGAVKQLQLLAHLSRWLRDEGLELADVDELLLERFFAARRAIGYSKLVCVRAAEPLLAYLRGLGVVASASAPEPQGPVEELLAGYRRYLGRRVRTASRVGT